MQSKYTQASGRVEMDYYHRCFVLQDVVEVTGVLWVNAARRLRFPEVKSGSVISRCGQR